MPRRTSARLARPFAAGLVCMLVVSCHAKEQASPASDAAMEKSGEASKNADPAAVDAPAPEPEPMEEDELEERREDSRRRGASVEKQERYNREGGPMPGGAAVPDAKPAKPSVTTGADKDAKALDLGASSDPLLAELGRLEQDMRRAGLRPPADPAFADSSQVQAAKTTLSKTSCEDLCQLRDAICGLETRICSLSKEHGEARYANACQRASADCRVASDACSQCSK